MKYEPADIVIYLHDKGIVLKEKSLSNSWQNTPLLSEAKVGDE